MTHQDSAIGVFDSGIVGFTVLHEIIEARPNENTILSEGSARLPYGTKSPDTVRRYSFENCKFLVGKHVKLVLVACNTASAIALDQLKAELSVRSE
jgi:glutamate racemase